MAPPEGGQSINKTHKLLLEVSKIIETTWKWPWTTVSKGAKIVGPPHKNSLDPLLVLMLPENSHDPLCLCNATMKSDLFVLNNKSDWYYQVAYSHCHCALFIVIFVILVMFVMLGWNVQHPVCECNFSEVQEFDTICSILGVKLQTWQH